MGSASFFKMRVAEIDIGTNTVLLLIGDISAAEINIVQDVHSIARLGESVDEKKKIGQPGLERTINILKSYRALIRDLKVERTKVVGTSALRDATNREEVISRISYETGFHVKILSGEEEARATFEGGITGLQFKSDE